VWAEEERVLGIRSGKTRWQTATVTDKVANVFESQRGNIFLNFGARYPNQVFTAFIPAGFSRPVSERERAGWPHRLNHGQDCSLQGQT